MRSLEVTLPKVNFAIRAKITKPPSSSHGDWPMLNGAANQYGLSNKSIRYFALYVSVNLTCMEIPAVE